jgi:pyruvate dehydrogenase E2 component (dihydrolipoamide acetyltransferase)
LDVRYEFKLPDLAEGMVEGELVGWLVAAGDAVKQEQPVAEVMTDKATVVIPSPVAGTVLDLPWQAGDIVKVGQVLVVFEAAGEIPTQRTHAGHVAPGETPAVAPPVAPPAVVAQVTSPEPRAEKTVSAPSPVAEVPRGSRALAAPATRRMARELGIDISEVAGSGPGGRVTPEDVQRHVAPAPAPTVSAREGRASGAAAPVASPRVEEAKKAPAWTPSPRASAVGESEERQKLRGLRRAIYETMSRSKRTAAHFTYVDEVDCENLVASHAALAKAVEPKGVRLTYLAFIAKACLLAIPRFPKINASVDDEKQEVILKKHIHLGIAAATEPGLVVPTIRHADRMSLLDLAWHIQDLGDRAKTNRLKPEELKGSTFTITSLGKLGGLFATPIINHPESAIVGVHQMQKRAVVIETKDGDEIVARRRMNLSLSFDHRLIDGHEGAAFAQAVKAYLEQPELMLLETV